MSAATGSATQVSRAMCPEPVVIRVTIGRGSAATMAAVAAMRWTDEDTGIASPCVAVFHAAGPPDERRTDTGERSRCCYPATRGIG